jgi:hypothetical protein
VEITELDGSESEAEVTDGPLDHRKTAELAPYVIPCDVRRMLNTMVDPPPFPLIRAHIYTWSLMGKFLQTFSRIAVWILADFL